jgi:hypothetical protein
VLKLLNRLQQRILDALNKVEGPNFVGTSEDDDVRPRRWIAQGEFDDEPILAIRHGRTARFVLKPNGAVHMSVYYGTLSRDDLFQVNAYMRDCELAITQLDDGEVLVQRRDVDAALQAAVPEFRKTDAFRRLDDALDA